MSGHAARAALDRKAMIAKLHIAKTKLALSEDSYRAILMRVARVASARDASDAQLLALLAEMRRLGFRDRPLSDNPQVRLIFALWKEMAPFVADASDAALCAFCRRQTGISRPEWLSGRQANQLAEGLKAWLAREQAKAEGGS